ncbi:MAG: sugar phosphate isomerase/epimerase family protein [Ruegeria sp.]
MTLPPFHLNSVTIQNASLADKFKLAGQAGFCAMEMWVHDVAPQILSTEDRRAGQRRFGWDPERPAVDANEASELARSNGLSIDGILPGTDVMQRWACKLDAGLLGSLRETIRLCARLHARYVLLPTLAQGSTLKNMAMNLREIGLIARAQGIRIGLEPMGHQPPVNTVDAARKVIEMSGLGRAAGIVLDTFHFFRARQELSALLPLAASEIVAVQINDAMSMPIEKLAGNRHRVLPGNGSFDTQGFCAAILRLGYNGPFTVEVMNAAFRSRSAQINLEICKEAYAASVSVMSAASGTSLRKEALDPI